MENNERKTKNSKARIKANNKYKKANYQRISVDIRPEQAEIIRNTAKQFDISIAQLIINSVNEYKMNHGADTAQPEKPEAEQPEQPENVTTESPMESEETAGTQPEQQEEETENEIETEETTEEEAEDIPEELKAVRAAWARMGAFNEKITAERKRREAEERKRRREGAEEERYMMR